MSVPDWREHRLSYGRRIIDMTTQDLADLWYQARLARGIRLGEHRDAHEDVLDQLSEAQFLLYVLALCDIGIPDALGSERMAVLAQLENQSYERGTA